MITFLKLGEYGRLGNQLFQIAATIGIARRNGHSAVFPEWAFQPWVTVETRPRSSLACEKWTVIQPSTFRFDETIGNIAPDSNVSLEGYFQTEKYFDDSREIVRAAIMSDMTEALGDKVAKQHGIASGNNICAVHVRRGDYLKFANLYAQLGFDDYYFPAMDLMRRDYGVKKFVVVSDDPAWCRTTMRRRDIIFSKNVGTPRDRILNSSRHRMFAERVSARWSMRLSRHQSERDLSDLMLMARCRHHIIANSSFSWWSSWLSNPVGRAVVAPKNWFTSELPHDTSDLYRAEMVRI
jgi:hypothetical protein